MKKILYTLAVVGLLSSCHSVKEVEGTNAFGSHTIQCMGVEGDGSQTLRSWGNGKNKADAVEQAKKNAVYEVLFKGIVAGGGECDKRPLLNVPNAREKYEEYFNRFFSDGGEYRKFVTMEDENHTSRIKADGGSQQAWSVIVRVKRSELRKQLVADGILKN